MKYVSTRNQARTSPAAEAILQGLAEDGGLFTPMDFPQLSEADLHDLAKMSYQQRAVDLLGRFLSEFSQEELTDYVAAAYGPNKFDTPLVAPVHSLDPKTFCLELWHGPTCAFKDMALQMLPHLLTASLTKTAEDTHDKSVCVLVATSGDTGKGALEGFRDVARTKILVFYPKNGVSQVQELQMITQEGSNVGVYAVQGNFDDAQAGVKQIFSDADFVRNVSNEKHYLLSSANSINLGRVLPQIIYYISAYCDLLRNGQIRPHEAIHVCVPTGNFGNILSAYYAKQMGIPIDRLICASNRNDVLTDFIRTGVYDRNRTFYQTLSPSMDILVSSNLERLLFDLSKDSEQVSAYMTQLNTTGRYETDPKIRSAVGRLFSGYFCDDDLTKVTIRNIYQTFHYLIDPHTATAFYALEQYRQDTGDMTSCLVASTASPFKFCSSVLDALHVADPAQGLDSLDQLADLTGLPIPAPLASLRGKAVRFDRTVEKDHMADAVWEMLR